MRNTIVKLLMAIAMCFVIGTALVACAGADGKDGTNGKDGKDGKDGTVVTVSDDGYLVLDGVKTDFKIKGENGKDGVDGTNGTDGAPGLSAYQIWLQLPGNEGKSEDDFFASLMGKDGVDANDCDHADPTEANAVKADAAITEDSQWVWWELGEHFVTVVDNKNVINDGIVLFTCLDCGESKLVKAVMHTWVEKNQEQDCCDGEFNGFMCDVCGTTKDTTPGERAPHSYELNEKDDDGNYKYDLDAFKALIENPNYNVCIDKGYQVAHCTKVHADGEACDATAVIYVTEPKGHVIDDAEWNKEGNFQKPTETDEGWTKGECSKCGNTITVTLPVQGAKDAEDNAIYEGKTTKAATCTTKGDVTYYFNITSASNDQKEKLAKDYLFEAYVLNTPELGHKLGIKGVDGKARPYEAWYKVEFGSETEKYVPRFVEYVDDNGNTQVGELDVYPFQQDGEFICGKVMKAHFTCELCKDDPITRGVVYVDVNCNHRGESNKDDASCNTPIDLYYECDVKNCPLTATGGKVLAEEDYLKKHDYKYDLIENKDGTFTLIKMCVAEWVDNSTGTPVTKKCYEQHDFENFEDTLLTLNEDERKAWGYDEILVKAEAVTDEFVEDGGVMVASKVATTCYALGYQYYNVEVEDGKIEQFKIEAKELLPHTLNGAPVDMTDGAYYDTDKGVYKFKNIDYAICHDTFDTSMGDAPLYNAYFICSVCEAAEGQNAVVHINVKKACVVTDPVITEATCDKPGSKVYTCPDCGDVNSDPIPALGHDYTDYKIATDKDGKELFTAPTFDKAGSITLIASCGRLNAENKLTCMDAEENPFTHTQTFNLPALGSDEAEDFYAVSDKKVSCGGVGTATYTFKIDLKTSDFAEKEESAERYFSKSFVYNAQENKLPHDVANAELHYVDVEIDGDVYVVTYRVCANCGEYVFVNQVKK